DADEAGGDVAGGGGSRGATGVASGTTVRIEGAAAGGGDVVAGSRGAIGSRCARGLAGGGACRAGRRGARGAGPWRGARGAGREASDRALCSGSFSGSSFGGAAGLRRSISSIRLTALFPLDRRQNQHSRAGLRSSAPRIAAGLHLAARSPDQCMRRPTRV